MEKLMRRRFAVLACGAALWTNAAQADTLREALAKAYETNPTLTAARAGQRANDENLPIARARGLPSATASATYSEFVDPSAGSIASPKRSVNGQLQLGGAIKNGIRGADARIDAGQADLRGTEATIFARVVGAYVDVLRDEAIVALNRAQVGVLKVNLDATKDRFQVGDLTRTDIAQSEARLARADSSYRSAEAQLIASRENYIALVGTPPGLLEQPPLLPNLPASPVSAVNVALEGNPDLIAANKSAEAARYDVAVARASRLPRVSAFASEAYSDYLKSVPGPAAALVANSSSSTTVGLSASIPLYQGGAPAAQVRQAQARQSQAMEGVIATERGIVAQARAAYASWQASNEVIKSSEVAVAANKLALEGVRAENSVGSRSILDILDAEQELLNAQVQLVTAKRNAYVAGFNLLVSMGKAEARDLGLEGGALYNPEVNYDRVKGTYWDWSTEPAPITKATRTVDTPPQNPSVANYPGK
jgi:outer membrane protein